MDDDSSLLDSIGAWEIRGGDPGDWHYGFSFGTARVEVPTTSRSTFCSNPGGTAVRGAQLQDAGWFLQTRYHLGGALRKAGHFTAKRCDEKELLVRSTAVSGP
jgi:hypothetical protein